MTDFRYWTNHEVQILKSRYPTHGSAGVRELLPHRSITAIHHKARDMRLSGNRGWSQQEIHMLEIHYHAHPASALAKMLPAHRTPVAIKSKLAQIGLTKAESREIATRGQP